MWPVLWLLQQEEQEGVEDLLGRDARLGDVTAQQCSGAATGANGKLRRKAPFSYEYSRTMVIPPTPRPARPTIRMMITYSVAWFDVQVISRPSHHQECLQATSRSAESPPPPPPPPGIPSSPCHTHTKW